MNKCGIITQARIGSTRLPAKILKQLQGKTVLEHHLTRLKWSTVPIHVATTHENGSEHIIAICEQMQVPIYQGSTDDVLARFYHCAKNFDLDVIIRVTSDCPLIDGALIDQALRHYLDTSDPLLYLSNGLIRTFPRGFDFEIFSFQLLEKAFLDAKEKSEREHVTPYLYNGKNTAIRTEPYKYIEDKSYYRITLDTEDDFRLLRILFEQYQCASQGYREILHILDTHPELANINCNVKQKSLHD